MSSPTTSIIDGNSLLALDVGTTTTSAVFFDVVEDRYRFVGVGRSITTLGAPYNDLSLGVRQALEELQELIGRPLIDSDARLILPSTSEGGVDGFVATLSTGLSFRAVLVGLLADVSLESAQRVMQTSYGQIVESIGLSDFRKPEEQIDSILQQNPDVIFVTGGTEGGATRAMQRLLETVGLSCYLMPEDKKPAVLFAGNSSFANEVKATLSGLTSSLNFAPNIRPSLSAENCAPAQKKLADISINIAQKQISSLDELRAWSGGTLLPNAYARGRMVRFLGNLLYQDTGRGVLSIDIGASSTTVAASFGNNLHLNVFPQFGLGEPLANLLRYVSVEEIINWIPLEVGVEEVRAYLFQKALYPATIPATPEDLFIEEAVARQVLYLSMRAAMKSFPLNLKSHAHTTPAFEPVFVSGGVFANAPSQGHSLLMLLDSLQPTGVTRLVLDSNNLLPLLGAAAEKNAILPVHVIESWPFTTLSTAISPVSNASAGTPILRIQMTNQDGGASSHFDIRQGALEIIPLASGQTARLDLQPVGHTDIGLGYGNGASLDITGGSMGVIVDARGRPLRLSQDPARRQEFLKKWLWTVGG